MFFSVFTFTEKKATECIAFRIALGKHKFLLWFYLFSTFSAFFLPVFHTQHTYFHLTPAHHSLCTHFIYIFFSHVATFFFLSEFRGNAATHTCMIFDCRYMFTILSYYTILCVFFVTLTRTNKMLYMPRFYLEFYALFVNARGIFTACFVSILYHFFLRSFFHCVLSVVFFSFHFFLYSPLNHYAKNEYNILTMNDNIVICNEYYANGYTLFKRKQFFCYFAFSPFSLFFFFDVTI